jgi:3-hydroxybutyryl-CoA dehydrogenase
VDDRLGIAGSGTIACGLAALAAPHGEVVLWARSEESAARAREQLRGAGGHDMAPDVRVTTHLGAFANASFVVEAVTEDREAKARLYAQLHEELDADAVLATTTSSLSVRELAAASGRPDRFIGLHVFNPVEKMELVELVHHEQAADDARARAPALCDDVDACMKLGAGHPMGPFALLDLVGLDVAVAIAEEIDIEVPELVRALVDEGSLGRKSSRGFHAYE